MNDSQADAIKATPPISSCRRPQIRVRVGLEFAGATPTLAPDGSLALTPNGPLLTLRKPVIYQTIAG